MTKGIDYDPTCEDLAEHFLSDELRSPLTLAAQKQYRERVVSLSRSIQVAVEDWFSDCPYVAVSVDQTGAQP